MRTVLALALTTMTVHAQMPELLTPAPSASAEQEAQASLATMFPHHGTDRWWLSGQANIIFQDNLPFHSPYADTNSFHNAAEYKTSMVETLYAAYRPTRSIRYNTDLILNVESAGGRGLSQGLGLAGVPNADIMLDPTLGAEPYVSRYEIHQVIGLTEKTESQHAGFFAVSPRVPVRRIEFRIGKMGVPDFFDINSIGSDSHLQFMNWTVVNNGAWNYAADTRGYTVGGMAEYDDRAWSLRYGFFAMPTLNDGMNLDWAFSRAHSQNGEFELRHGILPHRKGAQRILYYANRAQMGNFREAIEAVSGTSEKPDLKAHLHFNALDYGFGYNIEQVVSENLRFFGRFGWNQGKNESYAYTEVNQTVALGGDYAGNRWRRPADKIGLAFVSNAIKADHQKYLKLGGKGFLLGDGNLRYGRENIVEGYYTWHAWRGLYYAADVQHISNPGYNRGRGPVWIGAVRMHVDF